MERGVLEKRSDRHELCSLERVVRRVTTESAAVKNPPPTGGGMTGCCRRERPTEAGDNDP